MNIYLPVFLLIASPFIGSFLGLLAFRLPEHEDVVHRRSRCRACEAVLKPRDLVPIVSYFALRKRCRACGAPISAAYPLIETGALLVAIVSVSVASGWMLLITCLLGWALLTAAATDLRVFILPNAITLPLIPAGLAVAYFLTGEDIWDHIIGAIAGGGALFALDWIYERVRRRRGLGMGDVKLVAAAGAWLGWPYLSWLVLLAAALALVMLLVMRARGTMVTATTPLPFGAPLSAAFFALWVVRLLTV